MNDRNNIDPSAFDPWTCIICSKPVSSTRPPTFNSDNCSCVEQSGLVGGHRGYGPFSGGGAISSPYDQTHAVQQFQPVPLEGAHIPESNASTNINDIPCPEGIERQKPNLQLLRESPNNNYYDGDYYDDDDNSNNNNKNNDENSFLILVPQPGINEVQARRSFSFHHADLPFQLQRFLNSLDYNYNYTSAAYAAAVGDDVGGCASGSGRNATAATTEIRYALPAGILSQEMSFQSNTMMAQNQSSKKSLAETRVGVGGVGGGGCGRPGFGGSSSRTGGGGGADGSWYDGLKSTEQLAGTGGWAATTGWVDRDGDYYEGGEGGEGVAVGEWGYPLEMSGLLENPSTSVEAECNPF